MPKTKMVLDFYDDLRKDFPEYWQELDNWLANEGASNDSYVRMWGPNGYYDSNAEKMIKRIWQHYNIKDQTVIVWVSW